MKMEMTDFRKIYLFIRRLKGWRDVYYDKSNTLDEFYRYLLHMLFYEGTTDLASWAELVESILVFLQIVPKNHKMP